MDSPANVPVYRRTSTTSSSPVMSGGLHSIGASPSSSPEGSPGSSTDDIEDLANGLVLPVSSETDHLTGIVHSLETLSTCDGPGMRVMVFMQGCVKRCTFCHNPDSHPYAHVATWRCCVRLRASCPPLCPPLSLPYPVIATYHCSVPLLRGVAGYHYFRPMLDSISCVQPLYAIAAYRHYTPSLYTVTLCCHFTPSLCCVRCPAPG